MSFGAIMIGRDSDAVSAVRRDAFSPLRDDIAKLVFSLITKRVARFFLEWSKPCNIPKWDSYAHSAHRAFMNCKYNRVPVSCKSQIYGHLKREAFAL